MCKDKGKPYRVSCGSHRLQVIGVSYIYPYRDRRAAKLEKFRNWGCDDQTTQGESTARWFLPISVFICCLNKSERCVLPSSDVCGVVEMSNNCHVTCVCVNPQFQFDIDRESWIVMLISFWSICILIHLHLRLDTDICKCILLWFSLFFVSLCLSPSFPPDSKNLKLYNLTLKMCGSHQHRCVFTLYTVEVVIVCLCFIIRIHFSSLIPLSSLICCLDIWNGYFPLWYKLVFFAIENRP